MHQSRLLLVFVAGILALSPPAEAQLTPRRALANDNRTSAGKLRNGVLTLTLVARQATWYPEADDGPFKLVEAFGESEGAPRIPAPLIRVPLGTTIDARITNALADTLTVLGLPGRFDTLAIAPKGVKRVRFTPRAVGSFLYAAGQPSDGGVRIGGTFGQMVGGLIVPMHLHRFYYRIDARGGWDVDTLYSAAEKRWVVTENLPARVHVFPGETYDFEFESMADVVVVRVRDPSVTHNHHIRNFIRACSKGVL